MFARIATFAAFAVWMSEPALAQTDLYAAAHAMSANQLGVLEYCQTRGDVGPDAVAAQRGAIARLPATTANNDADEALGKQGTIEGMNGMRMTLDKTASAQGSTVSAICKQLGSSVIQSASAFQQNGMAPGGMAMPNGMTMPAMPSGMAMPPMQSGMTTPTMPNASGSPPR